MPAGMSNEVVDDANETMDNNSEGGGEGAQSILFKYIYVSLRQTTVLKYKANT